MVEYWTENSSVGGSNPPLGTEYSFIQMSILLIINNMKQSSKTELLNRLNNKLSGFCKTNSFSLIYSKDAVKYLEILYKEGRVNSYKKVNNRLIAVANVYPNSFKDKVLFEKAKNKPVLRYQDIIKIKSSLKTIYFHTNRGPKTLEQLKKERLGGVPIFYI